MHCFVAGPVLGEGRGALTVSAYPYRTSPDDPNGVALETTAESDVAENSARDKWPIIVQLAPAHESTRQEEAPEQTTEAQWPVITKPSLLEQPAVETKSRERTRGIFAPLPDDYRNFYSTDTLTRLAVAFGAGFVFANTDLDEEIQRWY